jgi:hypothetical protein
VLPFGEPAVPSESPVLHAPVANPGPGRPQPPRLHLSRPAHPCERPSVGLLVEAWPAVKTCGFADAGLEFPADLAQRPATTGRSLRPD